MPRPRFSNRFLGGPFVVPATGTLTLVVDLLDSFYPQIMIKATWQTTAATTGLSGTITPGFVTATNGNPEYGSYGTETVEWVDNPDTITDFATTNPIPGTGTPQTKRTGFSVNPETYPRFIKLTITNNDTANPVTLIFYGDW